MKFHRCLLAKISNLCMASSEELVGFLSKNWFFENCGFSSNVWVKNCIAVGRLLLALINPGSCFKTAEE